uniref:Putative calcium channel protein n=1 Tax=Trypanosoma congolense (strain IL3000) TaxID=1068625 RepID=G0UVS3_TRYCI|nr:putative calcium channel protein [Trypanosoma congolense IL3000]
MDSSPLKEAPTEGRTARDTPRGLQRRSSVSGRFPRLGYDRSGSRRDGGSRSVSVSIMQHTGGDEERNEDAQEDYPNGGNMVYEHVLFPGPRLRYRHVMKNKYTRVFERCMDCNTYQQMPLRAPPNVEQRTPEQLHAEHCHMAAVRSSRQLILNAIMGYVRLQKEISQPPTRDAVETVLGQAWSCGMLLFETIEYLSCSDIEQREYRTWDRTLEALQLQQWLIGLHVGEEQVGRATLAYILAHRKREKLAVRHTTFQLSWRDRSLFFLSPNSEFRRVVTNIVESKYFEWFILAVIFISSFCLCFHIPGKANDPAGGFVALRVFDGIFTAVFLVEMLMKWLSMGVILFKPEAYFWHPWNVFDFTITIVSLIALAPQFSHLRSIKVLRCIRVLAFFRNNNVNRGLAKVSSTILNCIPTVANVLLLFFINYFVWAVIALRLFNGKAFTCTTDPGADNATCSGSGGQWVAKQRNFDTFGNSFLTMIEVSVGSKWLDIIYMGVDGWSSEHAPIEDYYLAKGFFFVVYYYISHLILFSLFTASIVYCYLLTKNTSEGVLGITFEHQLWMRMQRMTLQLTPRVKLVPMKNKASQLLHRVVGYHGFQIAVVVVILLNVFTMSLYWYGEAKESVTVLDAFQYIWTLFFTFESAAMLGSYGMRSFSSWAFCFDFFVLVFSYIQVIVKASGSNAIPFNVNALRMLRVGRFFAVAELYVPVRKQLFLLHEVLLRSSASLANVTLILLLGVFTFAVLGLHLVGGVATVAGGYIDDRYTNFNNFGNSLMMTFRLTTLENWSPLLRAGMNVTAACEDEEACVVNNWSPFFFTLLLVCLVLVILGLYIAVIVDHYITASRMNASVTRIEDLHRFRDLWSQYDPNASLVLPTKDLPKILESLQPPLGLSSRHNRAELLRLLREYDIPDHRGKIYYHEVLLPLARRVLAMAFTRDTMDYRTTFETLWRHSEKSLRALPTVLAKSGNATVAQHFAASYLQAICRRKKAYRLMQQARSDVWRDGRVVCDELGLPYGEYGFGRQSLDGPDPMHEPPQGSVAPADAEARTERRDPVEMEAVAAAVAPSSPTWRSGQADSPSSPMSECQAADGQPTQARLPGTYQPAIDDREKRFGPDVPNALRRHETRSEKLRRKDEERYLLSPTDETSPAAPSTLRSNSQRLAASDYQPPLGTDPTSWLDNSRNRGGNVGTSGQDSRTNSGLPSMQGLMTP